MLVPQGRLSKGAFFSGHPHNPANSEQTLRHPPETTHSVHRFRANMQRATPHHVSTTTCTHALYPSPARPFRSGQSCINIASIFEISPIFSFLIQRPKHQLLQLQHQLLQLQHRQHQRHTRIPRTPSPVQPTLTPKHIPPFHNVQHPGCPAKFTSSSHYQDPVKYQRWYHRKLCRFRPRRRPTCSNPTERFAPARNPMEPKVMRRHWSCLPPSG